MVKLLWLLILVLFRFLLIFFLKMFCVPSFTFNLISVSRLINNLPCCLLFHSTFCFIQDLTCWKTIGVGEVHDGLYLLQDHGFSHSSTPVLHSTALVHNSMYSLVHNSMKSLVISCTSSHIGRIWHLRLGHPWDSKRFSLKHIIPDVQNVSNKTEENSLSF